MESFNDKKKNLIESIENYTKEPIMIAFSGGVDSSLLLKMCLDGAMKNGTKVYAVLVQTRLHPKGDLAIAQQVARETGALLCVLHIDELKETNIQNNPKNRCYLCKRGIFKKIKELAKTKGIQTVLEGTNEDDLHLYRPGIQALKELEIISPLADNGITKEEVRRMAAEYGISVANRPSMPCMATRLPYDTPLDYELLGRIEEGEIYIRELGFYNVRLRIHGEVARIEVDAKSLNELLKFKESIVEKIKNLGFHYVCVDLEGFRSGSYDQ